MASAMLRELCEYLCAPVVTRARHMVLKSYKAKAKVGWDNEKIAGGNQSHY
jgi:hypothetical protein